MIGAVTDSAILHSEFPLHFRDTELNKLKCAPRNSLKARRRVEIGLHRRQIGYQIGRNNSHTGALITSINLYVNARARG